jgi:hypothetical protein
VSETEEVLRDNVLSERQISRSLQNLFWHGIGVSFSFLKRRKYFVVAFVVIIAVGFGVYEKYYNLTAEERAQKELAKAVAAVSELMILPKGDEPVLATVTDAETLIKQQAFFARAMNGDQLLLFPKNMKAVIYSPSRKLIVNVGPIQQSAGNQQTKTANNALQEKTTIAVDPKTALTVEIRNGTGKTGYAAQIAEQISADDRYAVIKVADATKKDYGRAVVFDRSKDESKKAKLNALINAFSAESISDLPKGEEETTADALIILGGN